MKRNQIVAAFEEGKEVVFGWDQDQTKRAETAMSMLEDYLRGEDVEQTFPLIDKADLTRQSFWVGSMGAGRDYPFVTNEKGLRQFDGDLEAGKRGIRALGNRAVRKSLETFKRLIDEPLVECVRAVGLDEATLAKCTIRYRAIRYQSFDRVSGIGIHPDGNFLSGLVTNASGLKVYDMDGTLRQPPHEGVNIMGGSTLSRWSGGRFIPTFHSVDIRPKDAVKTSVVGFFNLPDLEEIPRAFDPEHPFRHDVKWVKEDDSNPNGVLKPLWDVILDKHRIVIPK